jgi:hypothetical protein
MCRPYYWDAGSKPQQCPGRCPKDALGPPTPSALGAVESAGDRAHQSADSKSSCHCRHATVICADERSTTWANRGDDAEESADDRTGRRFQHRSRGTGPLNGVGYCLRACDAWQSHGDEKDERSGETAAVCGERNSFYHQVPSLKDSLVYGERNQSTRSRREKGVVE